MSKGQVKTNEIDPRRYRGKVKIRACTSPAFDTGGRKFDSSDARFDGARVPTEQIGEILDYEAHCYRGDYGSYGEDFVLVRLNDGREYWYEWSEMYFTRGGES